MPDMRIADFLRHDVQAYGVPGAPDIDRILQACIEAVDWIDKLESRIAQVERERDAAVDDARLGTMCDTCKHNNSKDYPDKPCYKCDEVFSYWEWRGLPENTKEDGNDENA